MSLRRPRRWAAIVLAIAVAATFFVVALSGEAYRETSPPHLAATIFGSGAGRLGDPLGISFHVLVRKVYSVVAFAIVGATAQLALPYASRPVLRMALVVAAYSAAIELGQHLEGAIESPWWNAIDIACGALGGALGARLVPARWMPRPAR